jgi:hypothetical protein
LQSVLRGLIADNAESCFQALCVRLGLSQLPTQLGAILDAPVEVCVAFRQFLFHLSKLVFQPVQLLLVLAGLAWLAAIQGVEFFVHSPWASHTDSGAYVERNDGCLVLHATFEADLAKTKVFFGADIRQEPLSEMIRITRAKNREERLESDIIKIPHHSSYLSLGPDKGATKTKPTEDIAYFYEKKLLSRAILISTSKPIPTDDEDNQPPHRQAANYYKDQADAQGGSYVVTMDNPKTSAPETLVIEITGSKAKQKKIWAGGLISAVNQSAPRAGSRG